MLTLGGVDGGRAAAVSDALPGALAGTTPIALGFTPAPDEVVPEGTAVVIATSGSSGIPKRVVLSAAALRASAEATAARIGTGQWMLALPAAYIAGVQVIGRSQLAGYEPVLLEERFAPDAFVRATEGLRTDVDRFTSFVPAQLQTLLDAADDDERVLDALRSYRAILIGGQALPDSVRERAVDTGVRIVRTYGSSETAGGCVYDGVPLEGVRLAEVDGEIRIAGPHLATGYLGDAALTAATFVSDNDGIRWYRTGDAGTVAEGRLRITGRLDNVIVSGGINVSLDRVERVVRSIRGFEQAVVVGIPDERWGEASVVFATGADAANRLDDVRERVADEIGRHARPVRIQIMPELPLLASGKPDREALRRLARG
ncbi:AMP-binding protein [Microbacterium esteraromaticum]|uniref:AMP-binding protein n=1 Tax=Microbacterium esteraromaticum TaxID=57043 RepID=UPI001A8E6930|nr:AMP-binding protein [Microbacterium esteraromaticum]MBN8424217.1 AMP-binding protein [Microbacterium esteraromaticum]